MFFCYWRLNLPNRMCCLRSSSTQNPCTRIRLNKSSQSKLSRPKWMTSWGLVKVWLSDKVLRKVNTLTPKIHHFLCLIDTTPVGNEDFKPRTSASSTVTLFVIEGTINQDQLEKPASKKNCRNKRLQVLHGQMAASQNFSTIVWEYFNNNMKETHFMTFCFLLWYLLIYLLFFWLLYFFSKWVRSIFLN